MRLNEIRLRGCVFTLFPAAKAENVQEELMYTILKSIYQKVGVLDKNGFVVENANEIEKQNPDIPVKFEKVDFGNKLSELKEAGLVDDEGNLTEKTVNILERAAEEQKKMDNEGFRYCPCRLF